MDLKTFIQTSERGTAKRLAAGLGISPSFLSQLAANESLRTPKRCVEIEAITDGKVPRQHLRSDWREIWPELPELPAEKDAA